MYMNMLYMYIIYSFVIFFFWCPQASWPLRPWRHDSRSPWWKVPKAGNRPTTSTRSRGTTEACPWGHGLKGLAKARLSR